MPRILEKKVIATLDEIASDLHGDGFFDDVMGINIPDIDDADDSMAARAARAAYLATHGDDKFLVSWPEHVTVRRFNSDANYQPA